MRLQFYGILFFFILLSGGYVYSLVEAVCKIPVTYRIGEIDARFDITRDEVRLVVAEAESVWEQATGKNLFTYDTTGELVINFIFDERQALSDAQNEFEDRLSEAEDRNNAINESYEELVTRYDDLREEHETKVTRYEADLVSYNREVQRYNAEGGAPAEEFERLETERTELDRQAADINATSRRLNNLVAEINALSEQGNELIEQYNENVDTYNDSFGESREFTQGDYRGDSINIYKFDGRDELRLVLAHELGHALSLDHVPDETAIMHHLLGEQPMDLALAIDDIDEFERLCGRTTRSWIERLYIVFGI